MRLIRGRQSTAVAKNFSARRIFLFKLGWRRRRAGSGREKPFDLAASATRSYSAQRISPRIFAPESS
jgi:hypothetical protein